MKKPKTHDYYRNRRWGHDYTITDIKNDGKKIRMMGWGAGIEKGDFILIQGSGEPGANPDTRYKVSAINYHSDPKDMWTMEAAFAPRKTPLAKPATHASIQHK